MSRRPIFYDTETTGLRAEEDCIIEIAAYDPERDRSFVHLINPKRPIPPETSAVHKITDEMVSACPTFAEIGKQFVEFCDGEVVLIAHNNDSFDQPFLTSELARHQIEMPSSWRFLDSLKWARRYRSDLPRHGLQVLREAYGIVANQAHRALDDVIVLFEVFRRMTDDLTIDQVCALMNKPRDMRQMPFGKYQGQPLETLPRDYVSWLAKNGALDKAENRELREALEKIGLYKAK